MGGIPFSCTSAERASAVSGGFFAFMLPIYGKISLTQWKSCGIV